MARLGSRWTDQQRRVAHRAKYEVAAWLRDLPVRRHQVLYESFGGNGMLDHPEAIFRALHGDPRYAHLEHVWALSDLDRHASTVAEFAGDPRVRFVARGTTAYLAALARSRFLVNNATFPQTFAKRPGQVYLNTWHGTPLKTMGYEMPDGAVQSRNVVRNFLSADYLLAPNPAVADMYLRSYRLQNIFPGHMICAGSPRIDAQFAADSERERTRSRLRAAGVALEAGRRVVLYAPTWKGKRFGAPVNDVAQLRERVRALQDGLDPTADRVLLKVHQALYRFAAGDPALREVLVPNDIPTNQVLAVTDVLVSDYSSVFVDFLVSGRPIVFFMPDLDDYLADRGVGLPPEQWPGPICRTVAELADRVARAGTGRDGDPAVEYAAAYRDARDRYCRDEDGHATDRVVEVVFGGRPRPGLVRSDFGDGRKSMLIYLGGVLPNGITASARSLLDAIDYERFDVSVFYNHTTSPSRLALIDMLNEKARRLPRDGELIAHHWRQLLLKRRWGRLPGASHARDLGGGSSALRTEWVRCFGDARFDYVVDFSGYSPFWTKVLLQGRASSFSIWLHNDLAADARRKVDGRYPHRANLEAMFELYRHADHLVSVSPALAEVNAEKLASYAPADRFTWARNAIDYERIRRLAYGGPGPLPAAPQPGAGPGTGGEEPDGLDTAVAALVDRFGPDPVRAEVLRRGLVADLLPPGAGLRTFVTVGRLSPEKNHARMVKAFGAVHREYPDTRLLIIGSGPLRSRLDQLVQAEGLSDSVVLAGHQPNPYPLLAASDCFVLSSDYEGQPMVILEALVLDIPVVTTAFGSVADALPEGHGMVVERSERALADGMRTFLRGELRALQFDAATYNKQVRGEFEHAVGA